MDQATALGQRGRMVDREGPSHLGIGTNLISKAGPATVFSLCQGPKRKERLGKEWYCRALFIWCWRTGTQSSSCRNAGIGSSRDVVLKELSFRKGYQQRDEGTEKSTLSTGERNWQEKDQVSESWVSKLENNCQVLGGRWNLF